MLELNLQLFAADNIAISNDNYANYFNAGSIDAGDMAKTGNVGAGYKLADGTTAVTGTLADLSTEMKEFYSNYLIKDVGPNLIHAQFLDAETLPKNHGRTIEWRKWTDFTKKTTPLTEGVTPEPSKISANPIRAEIAQYGDWTLLSDLVQLQTIDNTLVEITEKHSQNAKLTLDTITREKIIAGCTNIAYAGGADSIPEMSSAITPNDCARLTAYLRQNNAPTFDGSYVMIVHPYIAYDLMTNANWIDVVKYSDSTKIFNGEIGKLYGIRFVQSTEAKVNKAKNVGTGTAAAPAVAVSSILLDSTTPVGVTLPNNTLSASDTATTIPYIYIQDVSASTPTFEKCAVSSISGQSITLSAMPTGFTAAAGDIVYLPESAVGGKDYFTCIVLGKGAGRRVDFNGSNAQMIIKPVGSAGATDPLNQRGSVGWKVDGYTAAITNAAYVYKYYCVSALDGAKAND